MSDDYQSRLGRMIEQGKDEKRRKEELEAQQRNKGAEQERKRIQAGSAWISKSGLFHQAVDQFNNEINETGWRIDFAPGSVHPNLAAYRMRLCKYDDETPYILALDLDPFGNGTFTFMHHNEKTVTEPTSVEEVEVGLVKEMLLRLVERASPKR